MSQQSALFEVHGMWCASCARAVEKHLSRQSGVREASVSLAGETALLVWDSSVVTAEALQLRVAELGYRLNPADDADPVAREFAMAAELASLQRRLIVALVLGMWIMLPQWVLYLDPASFPHRMANALGWMGLILSLVVVGYSGQRFLVAGWRTLRAGAAGVDTLVALGALGSLALTAWQLSIGHPERIYLDSGTMLVTFLLLGRFLELRIRAESGDALVALARQSPPTAVVESDDGNQRTIGVRAVKVGATVIVAADTVVPVDATVLSVEGLLDCAWLTGESVPVQVRCGDRVEAGSRNLAGPLRLRVESVAGERRIDRIVSTLREFLARKSHLDALADRWSAALIWLLAGALACGVSLAMLTQASTVDVIARALTILVVTCPCAIGLAVPLVLRNVAQSLLGGGAMIHDPRAMEHAGQIDVVLFDKTGTLTHPGLMVADITLAEGQQGLASRDAALRLAAQLATGSTHPLSRALGAAAASAGLKVAVWSSPVIECTGEGLITRAPDGSELRLGRQAFAGGAPAMPAAGAPDGPQVVLSRNGLPLAHFQFREALQPGAAACIAALRSRGLELGILSGDHEGAVMMAADTLAIPRDWCWSGCSPEQKAQKIAALERDGLKVAFVGDGINDSPALASATLGISVHEAETASRGASALTLGTRGLVSLPDVLTLLTRASRRARLSLVWAAVYNGAAVMAAVAGWMTPGLAALAMIASSLSVTVYALRPLALAPLRSHWPALVPAPSAR